MFEVLQKPFAPPLLLSIILLILPYLVASSSASNNTRLPNGFNMDDYNEEVDETSPTSAPRPAAEQCNYSLCQDQQPSCLQLSSSTGCSCPGISGPHDPPGPPFLRRLLRESSGSVVAHWCAPASTVTHYLVQVEGWDKKLETTELRRQMDLGDVAAGAEVCVYAVNMAGVSNKVRHSCALFQPQSSESGLALKLGIVGGVVGLILMLVLALLLWRFKARRRTKERSETSGAEGTL